MTATYTPTHLQKWTYPNNYIGSSWEGWYYFLGQNRDSDCLTRSNFRVGLAAVKPLAIDCVDASGDEGPGVVRVREGHFLCGHVEWIAIHESNVDALKKADELAAKIEDYPALNEDDWSTLEDEEAQETWESLPLRDRLHVMRGCRGVSLFAARHNYYPSDDQGTIQSRLLGH